MEGHPKEMILIKTTPDGQLVMISEFIEGLRR